MNNMWRLLSFEAKAPNGVMTDEFIMQFDRYLDWDILSIHYDFSIDMLRIYQHRIYWPHILRKRKFEETFLREMVPNFSKRCWTIISQCQTLSMEFIHDFADKVDWELVTIYQKVGEYFLHDNDSDDDDGGGFSVTSESDDDEDRYLCVSDTDSGYEDISEDETYSEEEDDDDSENEFSETEYNVVD